MPIKYFRDNPDVAAAYKQNSYGMSEREFADAHFANHGAREGRAAPTATAAYAAREKDVLDAYHKNNYGMSLSDFGSAHWQNHGQWEGRDSPFTDPNLNRQYQDLQKQYKTLHDDYRGTTEGFKQQLQELQSYYEQLLRQSGSVGDGGIVGGGVVPGDGSVIGGGGVDSGGGPGLGTGGVVYGPDGTQYSSPAAALAAGVSNFTSTPPSGGQQGGQQQPPTTGENMFMQGGYQTGNSNPGGFISGANDQLFQFGRPAVGFPY